MNKIECCSLNDENIEINYNNYFIFPYYNEKTLTYISIKNNEITWYNNNLKERTPLKRLNKSLLYFYNNSKFNGYQIFVIGFLNTIQKFKSFAVFDLLLKDEIDGLIQSKKYSIRYDNVRYRFITNIPKSIKNVYAVFAQKYSTEIFNSNVINCLKSNVWEGFSLYKDSPYNYDEKYNLITNKVWEISQNKIQDIKFSIDDKNKITLDSIIIKETNNIKIPIKLGLEKIKVETIDDINNLKTKKIMYKTCNIDDIIYSKFVSIC